MSKVEVLLSSYNGEAYIQKQLESLSKQTYPNWSLQVRDDGSCDRTIQEIESWQETVRHRTLLKKGENIGVVASFFELIRQADEQNEYFCFCDQDDVWMPDKIERAVGCLENVDAQIPAMVCTTTELSDEDLVPIQTWPSPPSKPFSFYNALYQNVAVGATITFNRAALKLIRTRIPDSSKVLMHDWWLYLCISAFGKVIYDPTPSMWYRQHGGNAVGGEVSRISKLKKKWASFRKHQGTHKLVAQAKEFHRLYADQLVDRVMLEQLERFVTPRQGLSQRLRYLSASKLYRQSYVETLLFRLLILIGYI